MAMSKTGLSDRIMTALTSNGFIETTQNRALADAIAGAVIDEIQANAVVSTTVPGTGLLDSTAGPVTGSATGTGGIS